uniref:Uncharacterized protein n=1 Tax=Oryza barthii TaxID=65489 RepID=A0A0D3H3L9_9ORYZ
MSSSSEDAVSSLGTGKEDEKEGRVGGAIEARVVGKDSSKDGGRRGREAGAMCDRPRDREQFWGPRLARYLPPFGLLLFDPTIFNFPNMTTIFNLPKIIPCPYVCQSKSPPSNPAESFLGNQNCSRVFDPLDLLFPFSPKSERKTQDKNDRGRSPSSSATAE